jgi:hypothetical protein
MTRLAIFDHLPARLSWLLYGLCCGWLAVVLSWWLSACFDYGYPFWYETLEIKAHINEYAPQNPEKPGFAQLPAEHHYQAFSQISRAVHDSGAGLPQITYPGPEGSEIRLLNRDEINHLRDVAALLHLGKLVSVGVALLWLPLALLCSYLGTPARRVRLLASMVLALLVVMPLVIAGPETVFNTLHEWIFPPEHPWFFYWQESLMSTLMKAPALFGGLAVQIAIPGLLLTPFIHGVGYRIVEALLQAWRCRHAY